MSLEAKLRLTHIAEAARLIADYVNGVTKEAFLGDTLRQDAVIRRIQIIGEAVRHLHDLLAVTFQQKKQGGCAPSSFMITTE